MSTRCNIRFMKGTDSILFYKHHDGYPSIVHEGETYGMIPLLQEFFKWFEYNGNSQVFSELATLFIYWLKKNQFESNSDCSYKKNEVSKVYGDSEICLDHDLHGDIEYYYEVDISKNEIRTFAVNWRHVNDKTTYELINTTDINLIQRNVF